VKRFIFLRHGESLWNQENRFTGWTDIDLSERGKQEALHAAQLLRTNGFRFDRVYTSILKRAIRTAWIVLDAMDCMWMPLEHHWLLNERHYGALQGFIKSEMAAQYGEQQVHIWRRSYDVRPPQLALSDQRHPSHDPRYAAIPSDQLPCGESLADTLHRVLPFWKSAIVPALRNGETLLIVAHGNSIRALVQHLDKLSPAAIMDVNIPTGDPLVYELDDQLQPTQHYYLKNRTGVESCAPKAT
jgi:2,3-bisphosphoglycerate-dependent phosphoglycerate mutase